MSVRGPSLSEESLGRRSERPDEDDSSVCDLCQTLFDGAFDACDQDNPYLTQSVSLADHGISDTSSCRICRFLQVFLSMYSLGKSEVQGLEFKSGYAFQALMKTSDPITQPTVYILPIHSQDLKTDHIVWAWKPLIQISLSADVWSHSYWERTYPQNLDLSVIVRSFQECKGSHSQRCEPIDTSPLLDLKVIDCDTRRVVRADRYCQFVALSYVWGRSGNDATIFDATQWKQLPATIRQSIEVTKRLGYRFLWIDRFCIDQNDNKEKHTQIAQMGHIYAAAQLTIVAAAGSDPEYGLPGMSPKLRQPLDRVRFGRYCLTIQPPARGVHDVLESHWASRGWTFQESICSRRRLIFTDRQVMFLCNTSCSYEAETAGLIRDQDGWISEVLRPGDTLHVNTVEQATAYLKGFSARELSFDTDALDAILGALNTINGLRHLWGVPLEIKEVSGNTVFSIDLMWAHAEPARRRHGFPSWSSIGWAGELGGARRLLASSSLLGISVTHSEAGTLPVKSLAMSAAHLINSECCHQLLEITVRTADVRIVPPSSFKDEGFWTPDRHVITINLRSNLYVCYSTWWDVDPTMGLAHERWIKLIDLQNRSDENDDTRTSDALLVVPKGNHFERVALVHLWVQGTFFDSEEGFLREDPDGVISNEERDTCLESFVSDGLWRFQSFTEERIRLG